jgi:hypothetical protein
MGGAQVLQGKVIEEEKDILMLTLIVQAEEAVRVV